MSVETLLKKENYKSEDLREIMEILRGEGGCPWDREQDHKSIRNNLIEECYEVIEGIDSGSDAIMKEELGDLLLQVYFHARIAEEDGRFGLDDIADGICKKLILRHPHIFSDTVVSGSAEVLKNWDEIKKKEKGQKSAADSVNAVSGALPALMRASKIQSKAAKVGFTYKDAEEAFGKVKEECVEAEKELTSGAADNADNKARLSEELGDLLFAVANVARLSGINPEEALYFANEKFCRRFESTEKAAKASGKNLSDCHISEMISLWNAVKADEK